MHQKVLRESKSRRPCCQSHIIHNVSIALDDDAVKIHAGQLLDVGASEADPAYETSATLPASVALGSWHDDVAYATALAALAEHVAGSAFADPLELDAIAFILEEQAGWDDERGELWSLFQVARPLLHGRR